MADELGVLIDEGLGVEPPRPPLVEGPSPQVSIPLTPGIEGPVGRYPGGEAPDELDALIDEALAPNQTGKWKEPEPLTSVFAPAPERLSFIQNVAKAHLDNKLSWEGARITFSEEEWPAYVKTYNRMRDEAGKKLLGTPDAAL